MTDPQPSRNPLREITQPFVDAARAPRALWGNNLQYLIEGFLYFGVINYLVIYCVENIGTNELQAGWVVTILAGGITFTQFLMGGLVDRWGVRRGLLLALGALVIGRALLAASGTMGFSTEGTFSPAFLTLLLVPVVYSLLARFTSAKRVGSLEDDDGARRESATLSQAAVAECAGRRSVGPVGAGRSATQAQL